MLTLEDIRRIVDPEGYKRALTEHRRLLQERLAQLLVNYDLLERSPHVEQKEETLASLEKNLLDVGWAVQDIGSRLDNSQQALMPNRATRRRAKKEA